MTTAEKQAIEQVKAGTHKPGKPSLTKKGNTSVTMYAKKRKDNWALIVSEEFLIEVSKAKQFAEEQEKMSSKTNSSIPSSATRTQRNHFRKEQGVFGASVDFGDTI